MLSLIATRIVTIRAAHRFGVTLKLLASAFLLGLLAAESVLPPLAVAAGLLTVLASVIVAKRTLMARSPASEYEVVKLALVLMGAAVAAGCGSGTGSLEVHPDGRVGSVDAAGAV